MQLGYTGLEGTGKSLLSVYELDEYDFALVRNFVYTLVAWGIAQY